MRLSVPAALAAFLVGLSVTFLEASAAHAAATYLEINPSTVPAGDEVGLRASCDDTLKPATVSSALFGTVSVTPQYGLLTATVKVSSGTKAGDYKIDLHCPEAKNGPASATATLHVVAKVEPARGPATGGGGTAPERWAPTLIGSGLAIFGAGLALGLMTLRRRRLG